MAYRLGLQNNQRTDYSNPEQLISERDTLRNEIQEIERSNRTDNEKNTLIRPKRERLAYVERLIEARTPRGGALGDDEPTNYDDDFDAELEGITRGMSRTDLGTATPVDEVRPIPDGKVADETAGSKEEHKREDAMEGVKAEADAGGKSGGIDDAGNAGSNDEKEPPAKRRRTEGTPTGGSFIPSRGRTKLNHKIRGGAINPMVDKSNILYQDPSKQTTEAGKIAANVADNLAPSLFPDASKAMTAVSKVPFIGKILPMVL